MEELDKEIISRRTKTEAKMIWEARRAGVVTPSIFEENSSEIRMSLLSGERIKEKLDERNFTEIMEKIGQAIVKLHSYDIIHGDLTTSNMFFVDGNGKKEIALIDFGLSFFSNRPEDKAVDLHLLKEALESTHFDVSESTWKTLLKVYRENYPEANKVLGALRSLEKRGRYVEKNK